MAGHILFEQEIKRWRFKIYKQKNKQIRTRFRLILSTLLLFIASGFLGNDIASETKGYSLEFKNGSLSPSSESSLKRGELVIFKGTDVPLTVRLKKARGAVELPSSVHPKGEGKDLIFSLKQDGKVAVRFLRSGDFRFRIDGINYGLRADKCGVDVLPHFVEGVVHVMK